MHKEIYTQVAIVGGGVSGAALLFMLARYSDVDSVALFEKYEKPAMLNSSAKANSQTLHIGDIETNYDLHKAEKVSASSSMVANFIVNFGYEGTVGFRGTKMVLAVGEEEIERLRTRYQTFRTLFPYLELWDASRLQTIEPLLVKGRDGPVMAMGARERITTVDYGRLAESFIALAQTQRCDTRLHFKSEVIAIEKRWDKYLIRTETGEYLSDFVVVDAGAHALFLAHEMGYGGTYAMLPIGGSFYFADKALVKGKVYTMQHPKLPFAAVHADPDLSAGWKTRFGPTAFALPKLERYHHAEISKLFDLLSLDRNVLHLYAELMRDDDIRDYIVRNFTYELPGIGRSYFIDTARKIIPSLREEDIRYAEGYGGMRPQIIDKKTKSLLLGEAKIDTGEGIVFNMTPSPGASSCLGNALADARTLCSYLNKRLYEEKINKELCHETRQHHPHR